MLTDGLKTARIVTLMVLFLFASELAATPSGALKSPKKDAKWDVSAKFGPTKEIPIDVTEGTWMNVTVHPGGQKIAFDLLGDLYELPIQGGEARPLTQGPAWDMQPTYSPDGTSVAFTSDRAGGDNIWLMAAGGGKPRALTNERFRLYNSPAWSADSRYLVARKHFTSRRSLGAGEIWMVHRDGGKGVQMTKRPNQQKDLGEPALSGSGRWLYYSRDATPGSVFQYNKDPNPGIFSIFRLDRKSGRTDKFIGGPGGAIRPTPSPDNHRIAYIRRVRGRSVLIARELKSGREVVLTDQLDRDLQETWSIHGVYPSMAWTPDSQWVVYWAGGRLWRSSIHGARKAIPFHVKSTRRVHHALRSKVAVQPKEQRVRALRWPRFVYGSQAIVFEALGRLWLQRKASQKPVALTAPSNRRQFTPAPSPKAKQVAFATWNDQEFGAIRVGALRPGAGSWPVTKEPGHYRAPAWSPDRKTIAFEKLKGGWLRSAAWSNDPGIYVVSSRGGPMRRLTRKGFGP
ncbi:MAG: amidohydrolase, partial [Myxococcales bacterium]|nr:amidohydrolase [Myxococcales bacterium]